MNIRERLAKFAHDKLGWGYPNATMVWSGIHFKSECRFCGKTILTDSNGDWFHA